MPDSFFFFNRTQLGFICALRFMSLYNGIKHKMVDRSIQPYDPCLKRRLIKFTFKNENINTVLCISMYFSWIFTWNTYMLFFPPYKTLLRRYLPVDFIISCFGKTLLQKLIPPFRVLFVHTCTWCMDLPSAICGYDLPLSLYFAKIKIEKHQIKIMHLYRAFFVTT